MQPHNDIGEIFFTPISHVSGDLENESINIGVNAPTEVQTVLQGVEETITCGDFEEKKWHIVDGKKVRRKKKLEGYLGCFRGEPKFKRKNARNRRSAVSKKSVCCKYRAYVVVYQDDPKVCYRKMFHDHTGHVLGSAEDMRYMKPDVEAMTFIKEVSLGSMDLGDVHLSFYMTTPNSWYIVHFCSVLVT